MQISTVDEGLVLKRLAVLRLVSTAASAALAVSACASSSTQRANNDPEQTATTSVDTGEIISPEKRVRLQKKFCQATLDYLAKQSGKSAPSACKNVIMRTTDQFGHGQNKGYLVTVVFGEDRQAVDLGAVVHPDGTVRLRSLKTGLERANAQEAELQIRSLQNQVDQYFLHASPRQLPDGLQDLVSAHIAQQVPVDPWGTPYIYRKKSATDYEVFSAGPDKKAGTLDDVHVE